MPFEIDWPAAARMTHEIQDALAAGDEDNAYDLTQRPAFILLCSLLHVSPDVALIRLREQRELLKAPGRS